MRNAKETNLFQFLKSFHLTFRAADQLKELLNFDIYMQMTQRKLVDLGNVISRVVSMEHVIKMGDNGFRTDLIAGALTMLKQEITLMIGNYTFKNTVLVIEGYEENTSWYKVGKY
jgi:hypothetical protein